MTAGQCRAARALVGLSQQDLAEASAVAKRTIASFEGSTRETHPRTVAALVDALRRRGVEITEDGVRHAATDA